MLIDCNASNDSAAVEIKLALEETDFDAPDSAWGTLIRALVDHDSGSPEQVLAWESGLAKMPQPFRDLLPPLARLHELSLKAWPTPNDKGEMHSAEIPERRLSVP